MNLRSFFLPPYTPRRMGTFFVLGAIAALIVSTASPTNFRDDWLDPRWWARGFAVLLLLGGIVMILRPARRVGR
jgi:protein-S-isoprenylcysteine O-methyltransferase Ste14